jgi:hypothetical protein
MPALLIVVLCVTGAWFLLLRFGRKTGNDGNNARTRNLVLLFSSAVALWFLWFAIREYRPPISITEHWLNTLIALASMGLAIGTSIQAFFTPISTRLGLAILSLFISVICLLDVVISIPVS